MSTTIAHFNQYHPILWLHKNVSSEVLWYNRLDARVLSPLASKLLTDQGRFADFKGLNLLAVAA